MRVSKYNIYNKLKSFPDKWLIVQGGRGSFDVIDNRTASILVSSETQPKELSAFDSTLRETLLQRGYITELSESEEFDFIRRISHTMNKYAREFISLTILPTYNCNFRCEYCFEQNIQKHGQKWLSAKMSITLVDAVYRQMRSFRDEGKKLEGVTLFGGEPLLKGNRDVIDCICKESKSIDLPIYCISNGYYLDYYLDIIKKFEFKTIQVTIDGLNIEHDSRRYLASGEGTFQRIIENVDIALNQGVNITLRTNINRKNIESIRSLMDFYRTKRWTSRENFSFYFKTTTRCYERDEDAFSDVELMSIINSDYPKETERFKLNSIYGGLARKIEYMLENNSFAPMKAGYCGANLGMYTVDPFGDIYPCWDVLTQKDASVGYVDQDLGLFVLNEAHDVWKLRTVDTILDCKSCKYLLFCGGGCAAQAKVMNNDMNSVFCDGFQKVFDDVATEICERYLMGKQDSTQLVPESEETI